MFKYVEPVVFVYAFIYFLNKPTEKQLVLRKVCLNVHNAPFCVSNKTSALLTPEDDKIQAISAKWLLQLKVSNGLPSILTTLVLGPLCDQVGRKPVLWLALFGELVNAIGYFLNAWFISGPVSYLLIHVFFSGICGNFVAILMAAAAYVGDVSDIESRTRRMVYVDVTMAFASFASSMSSGVLLEKYGFLMIYGLHICLFGLIMVYLLFLEESYQLKESSNIKAVMEKITGFASILYNVRHPNVLVLIMACFCGLIFTSEGIDDVLVLYLSHAPLNFLPHDIGFAKAGEEFCRSLGALLITLLLVKKFGWSDASLAILQSLALFGYSLSLAFSKQRVYVFLSTIWGLGAGCGFGACRSSLSKMVSPLELGRLNCILSVLQILVSVLGSVTFTIIYEQTVGIDPSITYHSIAAVYVVPLLLGVCMIRVRDYEPIPDHDSTTIQLTL